jgi:hypothetical protein
MMPPTPSVSAGVSQEWLVQDVADQVFHEHRRAGTDHGDLRHS